MKIIKKVDTSTWKYVHTCSFCDSQLEVESKDVIGTTSSNKSGNPTYGDSSFTCTAYCIVCSRPFDVPTKDMPKLLIHEIKTRSERSDYRDER